MTPNLLWILPALALLPCGWFAAAWFYRRKIDAHIEALRSKSKGAGMDYFLMDTGRPLDEGLREYLQVRKGRL